MVQVAAADRVVVIGGGPTGLGAAHRLAELGHENFDLYEATDHLGGLARSETDDAGFVWDMGGHVQFSHYRYFDDLMETLLGDEWLEHERAASVFIADRFVPYPFQHNLDALPEPQRSRCRESLARAQAQAEADASSPENFHDWIVSQFGEAIADVFMLPYNRKVWAYEPRELSTRWLGQRVATAASGNKPAWGPNRTFRFPRRGGTGEIWRRLGERLPEHRLHRRKRVVAVDATARRVHFADGSETGYDALISTMPVDTLVALAGLSELGAAAAALKHSSVHVIGVGLHGQPPAHLSGRSWIYFPEPDCPHYRATVFSNYSPANVPDPARHWSLMLEVSESPAKPVETATVAADAARALVTSGFIPSEASIASLWHTRLEHGYPTPTTGRDAALGVLLPGLETHGIFSRGRFGAWKYEVSNQDHSLMQGVEVVDRLLRGGREPTLGDPARINTEGRH